MAVRVIAPLSPTAVAAAGNKTPYASCAYSLITEDALYPLRVAFDTRTGSVDRSPLFLDAYMVGVINEHYAGRDAVELYKAFRDFGFYDIGLSSFYMRELLDEYKAAWDAVDVYARVRMRTPARGGECCRPQLLPSEFERNPFLGSAL